MTPVDAIRAHLKDNDIVFVITTSYERSLIFSDVVVRVSPSYSLAMHVDTDEANAFANEDPSMISIPISPPWKLTGRI